MGCSVLSNLVECISYYQNNRGDKKMTAKYDKRLGWTYEDDGIGKGITESKMGLTKKQAHFLKVIKDFIAANGYSPSYEEMKQMNKMRSKSNVHAYVYALKKRGHIDFLPGIWRSMHLL